MSEIKHIEGVESFSQEVLQSDKPVLVDFWAQWCGPCKSIAPILEEISHERNDVTIVKVDVDKNEQLSAKYGIRSIPTMLLITKGEVEATKIGAVSKAQLSSFLDANI